MPQVHSILKVETKIFPLVPLRHLSLDVPVTALPQSLKGNARDYLVLEWGAFLGRASNPWVKGGGPSRRRRMKDVHREAATSTGRILIPIGKDIIWLMCNYASATLAY